MNDLIKWQQRIDLTNLSADDKWLAKAGMEREFNGTDRTGNFGSSRFTSLFGWWSDTPEGLCFWEKVKIAIRWVDKNTA